MPPPADHAARRAHLSLLAAGLIAEHGLEGATVRRLAGIGGFSTTIVTHYFPNKSALLMQVYRDSAQRSQARVDAVLGHDPADLAGCLAAFGPIDADALRDWKVNFAFWELALTDPVFAEEQRWWTDHAEQLIADVLQARGQVPDPALPSHLLTAVIGIAVRATFDPRWTPERQRQLVAQTIAAWC